MTGPGQPAAGVTFERVWRRYGTAAAVRDVSLQIEPGTLVTLLGPSGCGKTTSLRMIAGLEQPSEGRVLIGGRDVTGLPPDQRDVSMVFQSYALFPHMDVGANVAYGLAGQRRAERDARAREAIAQVGLTGFEARLPSQLSGGQQQRVAVARALVLRPTVLLFDEPLSNLDARLRRHMRDEIRALQQRLGLTVAYVTHDQGEALAISDRIVVMQAGQVAQAGTPAELYNEPHTAFVASFMGEANTVRCHLRGGVLDVGGLQIPVPPGLLARGAFRDGAVDVAIRPEALRIGQPGAGLAGTVAGGTFMGAIAEYTIDTAVGTLFVTDPEPGALRPRGTPVGLLPTGRGIVPVWGDTSATA